MISHFACKLLLKVSSLRWQSNPILAFFITYLYCTRQIIVPLFTTDVERKPEA
jgi:hypothetical protein